MATLALIFDDSAAGFWREGMPPRTNRSHDQNLFQLGHEALRLGYDLYFTTIAAFLHGGPARRVVRLFPDLGFTDAAVALGALDPDIMACVHPQIFAGGEFPRTRKIGLHPALYFVEMPYTYSDAQTLALLQAIRFHVDHVVVQNERMRQLVCGLYEWLCRWDEAERVHVAPLGIVAEASPVGVDRAAARASLGLAADDVAIVNGGGIWRWTEFNAFLRGYCAAVRAGAGNVHLFLAGFRQADNPDHADYIGETQAILRAHADLIADDPARALVGAGSGAAAGSRGPIHVSTDWEAAGALLPTLLSAGDFGLNVNADTLENWQSHRVRCLDYIRHGLPILATQGDLLSDRTAREVTHAVAGRTPEDFRDAVAHISRGEISPAPLRAGMAIVRDRLDSRSSFGRLLLTMQSMPRRTAPRVATSVLEHAWQRRRNARLEQALTNLLQVASRRDA